MALPDVKPIVRATVAMFRRFRQVEAELQHTRSSLRERVLLDRAKSLLIKQRHMSEPEAHRWLRRQAVERSRRAVEITSRCFGPLAKKDCRTMGDPSGMRGRMRLGLLRLTDAAAGRAGRYARPVRCGRHGSGPLGRALLGQYRRQACLWVAGRGL